MNPISIKGLSKPDFKFLVREVLFFLAFFFYILLRINPALYTQRQDPVFIIDVNFFRNFLNYPGGILDYTGASLTQLCYYPIVGAIIVTVIAWMVARLTAALIHTILPGHPVQLVHYIPAILLLILHSQYTHPLAVSLGFVLSLLFVLFQLRVNKNIWTRIFCYLGFGLILYYVAAGQFLLFALLCAIYEALYLKRPFLSILYLLIAAAIPYLARERLFLINDRMALLHLLPFQETYTPVWTPHILILFYIIIFLIYHPSVFKQLGFSNVKFGKVWKGWLQYGLQTLLLFLVAGCAAYFSFEKNNHLLLLVDYYARNEQWEDIIRVSRKEQSNLLQVAFHTNRALFHTGQLLENMFSYPQNNAEAGLILPKEFSESAPLQESDFCYDLGSINEARHWAYEAVSTDGETPWILKRMTTVNFINGDLRAAERCLNKLDKMLFFKDWARNFRKVLKDPSLASNDETLKHGLLMAAKSDYIILNNHPPVEMDSLLKTNPNNKMAFEYRIAHELLTCRLGGLPRDFMWFNNFSYPHIPRHLEEAMLGFWMISKTREVPPVFRYIRPETLQRFKEFNKVLTKYNGDRKAAKTELQSQFGDTYWHYLFYNNPLARVAEKESSRKGGIE